MSHYLRKLVWRRLRAGFLRWFTSTDLLLIDTDDAGLVDTTDAAGVE